MSLFHRAQTVLAEKANAAINNAEDPGQAIDYSEEQLGELLVKAQQAMVQHKAATNQLAAQETTLETDVATREDQASRAVDQKRDDLAAAAIEIENQDKAQIAALDPQVKKMQAEDAQLVANVKALQTKISNFHSQAKAMKAEWQAAKASDDISSSVAGISEKAADINLMLTHAQDKIEQRTSHAQAAQDLLDTGALASLGLPGGGNDPIAAQLAAGGDVQQQLLALKAKKALPAATQATAALTDGSVVVRIIGQGQFRLGSAYAPALEAYDKLLVAAINNGDANGYSKHMKECADLISADGEEVGDGDHVASNVVVPNPTMSLADAVKMLANKQVDGPAADASPGVA